MLIQAGDRQLMLKGERRNPSIVLRKRFPGSPESISRYVRPVFGLTKRTSGRGGRTVVGVEHGAGGHGQQTGGQARRREGFRRPRDE
jgi:hypothetical protein